MTRIDIPGYARPPLSLNDRMHWRVKSGHVKALRTIVGKGAADMPPCESAVVTLHYQPRDRRRRDRDNLYATLKPCVDGLVDAGVLADDAGNNVDPRVELHEPVKGQPGAIWLTVEPIQKWGKA